VKALCLDSLPFSSGRGSSTLRGGEVINIYVRGLSCTQSLYHEAPTPLLRCRLLAPALLPSERLEEMHYVHLEAFAQPGERRESKVHLLALYTLEEARRHAAAVRGLLLRPALLSTQVPHGHRQTPLQIAVSGALVLLRPFGTASSFDPGPRHLAADRRNAYAECTTSLAT
jgi:hypothetical protein